MPENQGEWCTYGGRERPHGCLLLPCASDPGSPASVSPQGKGRGSAIPLQERAEPRITSNVLTVCQRRSQVPRSYYLFLRRFPAGNTRMAAVGL